MDIKSWIKLNGIIPRPATCINIYYTPKDTTGIWELIDSMTTGLKRTTVNKKPHLSSKDSTMDTSLMNYDNIKQIIT